jgi:Flavodoxin
MCTMKAVIVYESMYGNTHHVATAIGDGLGSEAEVVVVPVEGAERELVESADLLVVGGPTHVHGMSRASTRQAAVEAAKKDDSDLALDPDAEGPGLREWFDGLGKITAHAAAFDTRMHGPPAVTGRASKGIAKKLRHRGATLLTDPVSFLVTKETHLEVDEEERARAWGLELGRAASETRATTAGT